MATTDQGYQLSVLLVTYNHAGYIRQALESLFGQRIAGPIELVVADDGSSDDTLEQIRAWDGTDERFHFRYLDNTVNLGITANYQRGFAACTGRYVAVLEGDDYWVSPLKLAHQLAFLEEHWECPLCSVNYFVYDEKASRFTARIQPGEGYRLLGARELIHDNLVGNFSTCMYRRTALAQLPAALYALKSYDWIVNICVARQGLIGFLESPLSVYRLHAAGVWSQKSQCEQLNEQLVLIPGYDALTGHVFHQDFELLAANLRQAIQSARIGQVVAGVAPAAQRLRDYLPPVLLSLARGLVPPALTSMFARWRR
ncbi:MAG: glycosyltransferase [Desulfuromonadales bacterium]|nr:glycosyltransferase [Desulfuromonadales bacterium]